MKLALIMIYQIVSLKFLIVSCIISMVALIINSEIENFKEIAFFSDLHNHTVILTIIVLKFQLSQFSPGGTSSDAKKIERISATPTLKISVSCASRYMLFNEFR